MVTDFLGNPDGFRSLIDRAPDIAAIQWVILEEMIRRHGRVAPGFSIQPNWNRQEALNDKINLPTHYDIGAIRFLIYEEGTMLEFSCGLKDPGRTTEEESTNKITSTTTNQALRLTSKQTTDTNGLNKPTIPSQRTQGGQIPQATGSNNLINHPFNTGGLFSANNMSKTKHTTSSTTNQQRAGAMSENLPNGLSNHHVQRHEPLPPTYYATRQDESKRFQSNIPQTANAGINRSAPKASGGQRIDDVR